MINELFCLYPTIILWIIVLVFKTKSSNMKKLVYSFICAISLVIFLAPIDNTVYGQVNCESVEDLDQFVKVGTASFKKTNKVIACAGQGITLDFCCIGTTPNWNFTFIRPDGTAFPGGTNGVNKDQIAFNVDSTGTNAINEGLWQVEYVTPEGCQKYAVFEVWVMSNISPYVLDGNGGVLFQSNISAFAGDSISLGITGNGIDEQSNISFKRPDGATMPANGNEIRFLASGVNLGKWTASLNFGSGCSRIVEFNVSSSYDIDQYIGVNGGAHQKTSYVKTTAGSRIVLDFAFNGRSSAGWSFLFVRPDGTIFEGGTGGGTTDQIIFTIANSGENLKNIGKWDAYYMNASGASKKVTFDVNGELNPLNPHIRVNSGSFVRTNKVIANPRDLITLDFCCMGGTTGWSFQFVRPDGVAFAGGTNGVDADQIRFVVDTTEANAVNVGTWAAIYRQNTHARIEYFDVIMDYATSDEGNFRIKQNDKASNQNSLNYLNRKITVIDDYLLDLQAQIPESANEYDIKAYPNPTTQGYVDVDLSAFEGLEVDIQLLNATGFNVKTYHIDKASKNPERLDLNSNQTGNMFLRVIPKGKKAFIKRFSIEE